VLNVVDEAQPSVLYTISFVQNRRLNASLACYCAKTRLQITTTFFLWRFCQTSFLFQILRLVRILQISINYVSDHYKAFSWLIYRKYFCK